MNREYLSKDQTTQIKGILCILVVLCHTCTNYFNKMGAWAVAVFFFYAGYALEYTSSRKPITRQSFIRRMLNLAIPLILTESLYHILFAVFDCNTVFNTVPGFLVSVFYFATANNAAWYLVMLIGFTGSYLLLKRYETNMKKIIGMFLVLYGIFFAYIMFVTPTSFILKSAHWFVIGIIYCYRKDAIESFFDKHKNLQYSLFAFALITFAFPVIAQHTSGLTEGLLIVLFDNMAPVFVLFISSRLKFRLKILTFMGKISLWVYLLHLAVYLVIAERLIQYRIFQAVPVWFSVLIITIPLAYATNGIYDSLIRKRLLK